MEECKMEEEGLDLTRLSRADILTVRKSCLEEMIKEHKKILNDKVMILLGG
jgi:hypothetical protein